MVRGYCGMTIDGVIERLRTARRVAIFTHLRPDPDALGSQAAAALLLKSMGAETIYRMEFAAAPGPYRFLQEGLPGETALWESEWAGSAGGRVDTILLVDTCTYQQLEPAQAFLKAERGKVVAIDHHLSRDDVGPILYTDADAAACAEIMWELARKAGVEIDARIALPLMAGLVGDTGWFRFDSVRPRTHQMAADLVRHVNPATLYERLMQNESRTKLALMRRALASVRWSSGDRFGCMMLRHADFVETGATQSQTEYLVDMPMMVGTAEVVALMSEIEGGSGGRIRVSLRSKHDVDVNRICNKFGGGGHAKAAGCRMEGPLEVAYSALAGAVEEALGRMP
jgi:bifunctional oligoribonuclease and PAP phosphatase NrnA